MRKVREAAIPSHGSSRFRPARVWVGNRRVAVVAAPVRCVKRRTGANPYQEVADAIHCQLVNQSRTS